MTSAAASPEWPIFVLIVGAYLLGGISPGWLLVRRTTGADLRSQGSGATGASNVARVLGRRGYALVLALDTLKGILAVAGAAWIAPRSPWAALAAPAVVAGHIWPIWLGFKGGRGAATLMGDCLALHWAIVPLAWIPGALAGLITRKGFLARTIAFMASLPVGWFLLQGRPKQISLLLAWLLVLLAHREYFAKHLSG